MDVLTQDEINAMMGEGSGSSHEDTTAKDKSNKVQRQSGEIKTTTKDGYVSTPKFTEPPDTPDTVTKKADIDTGTNVSPTPKREEPPKTEPKVDSKKQKINEEFEKIWKRNNPENTVKRKSNIKFADKSEGVAEGFSPKRTSVDKALNPAKPFSMADMSNTIKVIKSNPEAAKEMAPFVKEFTETSKISNPKKFLQLAAKHPILAICLGGMGLIAASVYSGNKKKKKVDLKEVKKTSDSNVSSQGIQTTQTVGAQGEFNTEIMKKLDQYIGELTSKMEISQKGMDDSIKRYNKNINNLINMGTMGKMFAAINEAPDQREIESLMLTASRTMPQAVYEASMGSILKGYYVAKKAGIPIANIQPQALIGFGEIGKQVTSGSEQWDNILELQFKGIAKDYEVNVKPHIERTLEYQKEVARIKEGALRDMIQMYKIEQMENIANIRGEYGVEVAKIRAAKGGSVAPEGMIGGNK